MNGLQTFAFPGNSLSQSILTFKRMLTCGHSFCEKCIKLLYKPSTKMLTCPTCMLPHPFKSLDELSKLVKNYALLSLVESSK